MKKTHIDEFLKGWFVGNFEPTLLRTNDVEIAYKRYKAGDKDKAHYHKIATEFTLVTKGSVKMNGMVFKENEIIIMEPNEVANFEVLEDAACVVVKIPGANNDKYENELEE